MTFPVLLLQATHDDGQPRYYFDDAVNPAVALFPDARLEWVEGAGHYTNLEKPEVVTAKIEAFLHAT